MGLSEVISTTLADFACTTSINGLCNVGYSKSKFRKTIWMIIFITLSGYTITLLVDNVNQYLKFDVVTTTMLSHSPGQYFPGISICNQNK
jgi:hypothetical protein